MDENAYSHFCVYFAAYDPEVGQVFLGHHKKSGLWLFNGGHIDQGETPQEALLREIREEWGFPVDVGGIEQPRLLTITEIDNRAVQTCTRHFDIWYFVAIRKTAFTPHQASLADEFHRTAWLSPEQARQVVEDSNTLEAITILESLFRN